MYSKCMDCDYVIPLEAGFELDFKQCEVCNEWVVDERQFVTEYDND